MAAPEGRKFTLPARAWVALGLVALAQIGLLAMNVLGIARQEQLLERQLALAERSYDATRPAVQDARRLLDDARDRLPATKRRARDASRLVDRTRPLVEDAAPLVRELADMDAAGAVAAAGSLALRLQDRDRLVALIDRSLHFLRDLEAAGTLSSVPDIGRAVSETLSVQRRVLSILRHSLGVQRTTLRVQRKALRHIRSLDRKTGGPVLGP